MNTIQLSNALNSSIVTSNYFGGVFPADDLNRINSKQLLLCNSDTSDGAGEHWLLIFFSP